MNTHIKIIRKLKSGGAILEITTLEKKMKFVLVSKLVTDGEGQVTDIGTILELRPDIESYRNRE